MGVLRADSVAQKDKPNNRRTRHAVRMSCVLLAALAVCGCASMKTPDRLYTIDEESSAIRAGVDEVAKILPTLSKGEQRRARNNMIAARKYAIDMQYTKYEAALTHEAQATDFAAKAATIALGSTAELVPVEHTSRMLTGIATGVTSLDAAYNDKVLRVKMIENVQSSMRAGRHERAAVIYANMRCSIKTYPIAMALSDLEAYYRAGTFHAGLIKLSKTVSEKETATGASADAQKPNGVEGQAVLAGIAEEAKVKAAGAAGTVTVENGKVKIRGKHKCTPEDVSEDRG